jgi:hypothetical protein
MLYYIKLNYIILYLLSYPVFFIDRDRGFFSNKIFNFNFNLV